MNSEIEIHGGEEGGQGEGRLDAINAYKRDYYRRHPEKKAEERKRYRARHPEASKGNRVEQRRRYKARYPDKERARRKLADAVARGRIERPNVCSSCGREGKPEGHHEDYSKPFEVIWLCKPCHDFVRPHPIPQDRSITRDWG